MKNLFIGFIAVFSACSLLLFSQNPVDENGRMDWWREAKFGMFIHWGVYSVFENVYNGLDVNGEQVHYNMRNSGMPAEWIMRNAKIPRSIYREAAREFDAKDYDPRLWVQIAKNAGMKYIIITAKHHDGFCLFDSQHTCWDAADASAAGRDLLKGLVDGAKAAGLKTGFYYSQNLDWMHEGGMDLIPELNLEMYPHKKVTEYVNNLVIPHIRELADRYDFDVMWFDGQSAGNVDVELNKTIYKALKESPVGSKIISNDRLYLNCEHDFETPETDTPDIPYNGFPDSRDWEACTSLNNSWGYEGDSEESCYWKSPLYTIGRILEIASKGGNLLLNVGPDKHGVIPQPAVNTLAEVGRWMAINGEAVYGTEKNCLLNPFEYGYVTQKTTPDGRFHWYLHVSSGYWNEGKVHLYGIKEQPAGATYLADGTQADIVWKNNILTVNLPETSPNSYYTTVDLCFDHLPEQMPLAQIRDNQIRLTPYQAVTRKVKKDFEPCAFKEWYGKDHELRYNLYLKPGTYTIQAEYGAINTGELYFNINGNTYTGYYSKTDDYKEPPVDMNYITGDFSNIKIQIPVPGIYPLTITRNAEIPNHFNIINVRNFTLNRSTETSDTAITPNKILLCPNPVRNGYFYCMVPPEEIILIYDAAGRLLKSCVVGEDRLIDVSDLRPGIYVVTVTGFANKLIIAEPH